MSNQNTNVLILGLSGTGKSTSAAWRDPNDPTHVEMLDPATTGIINYEMKMLPFPEQSLYKKLGHLMNLTYPYKDTQIKTPAGELVWEDPEKTKPKLQRLTTYMQMEMARNYMFSRPEVKTVFHDSLTSMIELVQDHIVNVKKLSGFDVWQELGNTILRMVKETKMHRQTHIYTSVAMPNDDGGTASWTTQCQGKVLRNLEKEFTVVLCSIVKIENEKPVYYFMTNTDGKWPAKSPVGMFPDQYIPNNLSAVVKRINEYYAQYE